MTRSIRLVTCTALVLFAATLTAQNPETQTEEATTATTAKPAARVYVTSGTKIVAYTAAANGKLTAVPGSPFNFNVSLSGGSGKYLFGFPPNSVVIQSLAMGSNGALTKAKTLNTQKYNAVPDCVIEPWAGNGIKVDHSGESLYDSAVPGDFPCDTYYQSYRINSDGSLTFQDNVKGVLGGSPGLSVLGNDKFVYVSSCAAAFGNSPSPNISVYERMSNGELAGTSAGVEIPAAPDDTHNPNGGPVPGYFCPGGIATDPTDHAAILLYPVEYEPGQDGGNPTYGPIYVATYTADSKGNLKTTSTYKNMATLPVDSLYEGSCLACAVRMAPSGKLIAFGGSVGVLLYHFNGGSPITKYKTLLAGNNIGSILWDTENHMYALGTTSKGATKLWVYTVTPTSTSEAPGSPYSINNASEIYVHSLN